MVASPGGGVFAYIVSINQSEHNAALSAITGYYPDHVG
jgi:hypothetical protein